MNKSVGCSLCIGLFGPFCLTICGQKVPIEAWKSRKALLLFKYLATRYGEKIPSDVLIDFLWPDSEFDTATHNLHTTIYYLRKILKDHTPEHLPCSDWIQFCNGLYWLDTSDEVSVDVQDFFNLYRESEDIEQLEPFRSLEVGLRALELCRGTFLQEDLYADWAETIRENCRSRYVELTLRTSRLLVHLKGDYKTAANVCRTALEHAPYREELHQVLMRCLIAMGRLPEAVFQYNVCAKTLQDELDLKPSPQTRALLKEIEAAQAELITPASVTQGQGLICERSTFHSILTLEQRRLDRKKQPLIVMTIAMDEATSKEHVHDVCSAVCQSMRKSDVATHWSNRLFAVLLFEANCQGADVVQERIRTNLGSIAPRCRFTNHVLSTNSELTITQVDQWSEQIASC